MNANNINRIGSITPVIIDYFDCEYGYFVGRTNQNSPNVDFYIYFEDNPKIKVGNIYQAKIIGYYNSMFKGEII